jgi:hypothetical protein
VEWLRSEPADEAPGEAVAAIDPLPLDALAERLRGNPEALAEFVASLAPEATRTDGWTPFARRLFLEVLAETGRVSRACAYAGLTKQSAYALRHRDPLFAAGWDAACELARGPLADALYERALDGITDTISRNGEVIAERHRHDSRLSIAVLHRLDRRCDAARELGSAHLPLVRHWEEWLALIGKGEDAAALALIDSVKHGQAGQLPLGENPTTEDSEADTLDLSDRCWRDPIDRDSWLTDFPPPEGFAGYQSRPYDEDDEEPYERACTEEEVALLEADRAAERAAEREEDEALRDEWFALLRAESGEAGASLVSVGLDGQATQARCPDSTNSRAEQAGGSPSGEPG